MSAGLPAEGAIEIALSVRDGTIIAVSIENQRILNAANHLNDRSAGDAALVLTKIFAICRIAQGLAGAEAMERASGVPVAQPHIAARQFLLLGEIVLEHASRAVLDWPLLLGEPPQVVAVKTLRAALAELHRDLYPDGDWMRPGGGRLRPDGVALAERLMRVECCVAEAVFAGAAPLDAESWQDWQGRGATPAARLIGMLTRDGLAGFGASDVEFLPPLDPVELEARLADDDGRYVAHPDWRGAAHETGPLARQAAYPLIAVLGRGLEARFAARLVELVAGLQNMRDLLGGLGDADPVSLTLTDGVGLSILEAARGRLAHRVELRRGRVASYRILAPTEWNFHPAGPLARGLLGQANGGDPQYRARLLAAALDPCVAYRLGVM